jgi:phosphate transport system permease protein
MSQVLVDPEAARVLADLRPKRSWRQTRSHIMLGLTGLAAVLIAIPLVFVLGSVISRGGAVVFRNFPQFFTKKVPIKSEEVGPGMGPAILGTILVTGFATLIAVPLGILGAVYLHEYGNGSKLSKLVRFLATVMTGVPSIVMGLFIYVIFTLHFGLSGVGGSLALACLMLPVVIRATEEMLRLVPANLREASYALGTSKSRTVLTVVLPSAMPGIISGCLLAIARAAGETAPLLFTIGAARLFRLNIFKGATTALPAQIFENAKSSFPGAQQRGWGAAFTLVAIAFIFTLTARIVSSAYQKRR